MPLKSFVVSVFWQFRYVLQIIYIWTMSLRFKKATTLAVQQPAQPYTSNSHCSNQRQHGIIGHHMTMFNTINDNGSNVIDFSNNSNTSKYVVFLFFCFHFSNLGTLETGSKKKFLNYIMQGSLNFGFCCLFSFPILV